MNRITYIDIAKGIGIFLVVWGHSWLGTSREFLLLRMPLFLVLAGVFFRCDMPFREFFDKKIKYIILPMILAIALSVPYDLIFLDGAYWHRPFDIKWPLNKVYNITMWFLIVLIIMMLVTYVINRFLSRRLDRLVAYSIICLLGYGLAVYRVILPFYLTQAALCYSYFITGYLIGPRIKDGSIFTPFILCVAFAVTVYIYAFGHVYVVLHEAIFTKVFFKGFICSMSIVIVFLYVCRLLDRTGWFRWIAYVGTETLLILCFHIFFTRITENHHINGLFVDLSLPVKKIISFIMAAMATGLALAFGLLIRRLFPRIFKHNS